MTKEWFTVREIAEAMGEPKRKIERTAVRESWPFEESTGRGGTRRLYRLDAMPHAAQVALLKTHAPVPVLTEADLTPSPKRQRPVHSEEALSSRWERLRDSQREKAEAKCTAIRAAVTAHERSGVPLTTALQTAATGTPWSYATLRDAYYGKGAKAGLVDYPRHLWALVLAPGHLGRTATAECDPAAWAAFKADYLRQEEPTLEMCYRTLQRLAAVHDWTIPGSSKSLARRLEREMSYRAQVFLRKGPEALARMFPAQRRDRTALHALELVNADGHKFDNFVEWPDGEIGRPILVGWQDIRSGKMLSWRVDKTESSDGYRLSFADLLREHGKPGGAILDNGRGAAAKILTGGMSTRFRFKVKEEEPLGLFTHLLGEENTHFAKPYHGQSKPIERAFRDLASDVSKDARLAGAYTGKNPTAKPENYGSRAVPLARFLEVLEDGIRQHNARKGRRGMGMDGRSFDEVFAESYQANAHLIQRPTQAQLSRWLLAAVDITANKLTGAVKVHGNEYVSDALTEALAGRSAAERRVVVRLDPDNLLLPVMVETLDGRLIGEAKLNGPVRFIDTQAGRDRARDEQRLARITKEEAAIHQRMSQAELDRLIDTAAQADREQEAETPAQQNHKLVRGAFGKAKRVAGSDIDLPDDDLVLGGDEFILRLAAQNTGSVLDRDD
ncbi:transposase domain-containing protein [Sedimenticola hydrogenitrophicus]|uniref:transposase domain-containing protein n=1 Tax=Sedimenticola hydrogenitrophicus TaxID=2967975 RepID=UPI0023B1E188|nr:transposase domain-containing protein [Sedimenticola hydrogenitrophicus]